LTGNSKLERINLSFNEITKDGAACVPNMLRGKTQLVQLELNGNMFDSEGNEAKAIKDTLRAMEKDDVLDDLDEMEEEEEEEEDEDEEERENADEEDEIESLAAKIKDVSV
jgi:Ran GTPase-activating protein 1